MDNIINALKQLGLNDKEVEIFLSLLKSGPISVQQLARLTNISRSTVYQRLDTLNAQGLIVFERGEKGVMVRTVTPKEVGKIIEERIAKTQKLLSEFNVILPQLEDIYQPNFSKTKVMYFEGVKGLQQMIYNYDMEAKNKNLYGYTTVAINKVLGMSFIKKYHEKFLKKGYRDHFIMSDNKENKEYLKTVKDSKLFIMKKIFVRKLPEKIFNPKVSVSMYDDKYTISLMRGGKPFGVIIENQEIANHQMEIWRILWNSALEI